MCICWLAAHIHCLMKSKRTKHTTTPTTTLEHKKNLSKFSIVIHRESSCLDFLDDFCVLDRQVNMLLLISSQLLHIGCNKLSHSMKKKTKKIVNQPHSNDCIYFVNQTTTPSFISISIENALLSFWFGRFVVHQQFFFAHSVIVKWFDILFLYTNMGTEGDRKRLKGRVCVNFKYVLVNKSYSKWVLSML